MKRINQEKFFEVVEGRRMGREEMERIFANVFSKEVSNAQANRALKLLNFIMVGFNHEEFSWEDTARLIERFIKASEGMDKDGVRSLYRTFTTVPKFHWGSNSKDYKNLNCRDGRRDFWGRKGRHEEFFGQDYIKLMVKIHKTLKKAKKGKK